MVKSVFISTGTGSYRGGRDGGGIHWKLLSIREGVTLFGSTELPR